MREIQKYAIQMQYDINSLLEQQYDEAIIGVDLDSAKFIYCVDTLQKIIKKDDNIKDVVTYMDKEFYSKENKPIFCYRMNINDVKNNLKIIEFIKNNRDALKKYL